MGICDIREYMGILFGGMILKEIYYKGWRRSVYSFGYGKTFALVVGNDKDFLQVIYDAEVTAKGLAIPHLFIYLLVY